MSEPGASDRGGDHPAGLWPVPGDGVLARHGGLILLASIESGQFADVLLDLLERAAAEGGDGRQFTDAVADAIEVEFVARPAGSGSAGTSVLAFGDCGPGLAVAVGGGAWADVTTALGTVRLEAAQPGMLLRALLREPATSVRAGLARTDDGMARTDRFSRLDGGTVRAGGLAYYVGSGNAGPARRPPVPDPAVPDPAVPEAVVPEPAVPEPTPSMPAVGPSAPSAGEHVPTEAWLSPGQEGSAAGQVPGPAGLDPERAMTIPPAPADTGSDVREVTGPGLAAPGPGVAVPPAAPDAPVPAMPVPPAMPAEAFEAVLLSGPGVAADIDVPRRPPLSKVRDLPPGTSSYVSEAPIIQGVYCKNGHFDDPEARFCAVCGISMNQQTLVPRPGQRPPLGVLVLDDGAVFQLDSDYVVGREPSLDSSVAAGRARSLRVTDESGIVSRVHARVHLEGWRVLVTDLGSANGTRVRLPHQPGEQAIAPQVPVVLSAGSQVDLGGRGFRYESHRGR